MGSSGTKAKRPKRRSRSTAGDAFVVLAMTLTTVALAIGLYLQFRLAFWLAVVAALSVYVGLLALHVLVRRSERVEHLTAEIQRLEAELSQAASPVRAAPNGVNGTATAGPAHSSAPSPSHVAQSHAPQSQAPQSQALQSQAPGVSITGIGTVQARQSPSAPPLVPALSPAIPPVSAPQQSAAAPQPVASASTNSAGKPAQSGSAAPAVSDPGGAQPVERPGMSDRAVDAIMNDYWAFRPAQPPRLPEPGPAGIASPDAQRLGPAPGIDAPSYGEKAADAHQRAATPPPVPMTPPPMPSSPRQSDVEMIGGLIKKMADEINAVEAGRLHNPAGGDRVPPAAIEASVNALRTTADQMRGAAASPPEPIRAPARTSDARAFVTSAPGERASGQSLSNERASGQSLSNERASGTTQSASTPVPRDTAPAATPQTSMPPPLPVPAPLPVTQSQQTAPPPLSRHAMDRPGARELPPQIEPGNFASMPWPEDTSADNGTEFAAETARRPAAAENTVSSPSAIPPSIGHSRLAALAEAITAGRLDVLLDPILGLADQRARHFEVSVRLRDKSGNVLEPPDGVPELRESGLLPLLDCARIQKSAQVAHRLADRGKPGSLFSAFSGESLSHDQFLSDFADLYATREALSAQLVLSFAQADVRAFANRDWDTVAEMHELGFRFALQSVTDLDFDLEALKSAGFDFVKLDASVFLDGMPASGGVIPSADICRHLAQLGMTLIVGQIDDEAQLARIFGFGVIYGQGQLFGGARPMKSEALTDAGHAAA